MGKPQSDVSRTPSGKQAGTSGSRGSTRGMSRGKMSEDLRKSFSKRPKSGGASLITPRVGVINSLETVKGLFKPYRGDLFGNSGTDNTDGMLYLSRLDPSRDPKKATESISEEMKRRSLAMLGGNEGVPVQAEEEAHRAAGEERRRRFAISLATLASKPWKQAEVVAKGGIHALARLSRTEESRTRSSCAQVWFDRVFYEGSRRYLLQCYRVLLCCCVAVPCSMIDSTVL
ncbi:unnamed protein product [Discosporangium mesarthrocarpum]